MTSNRESERNSRVWPVAGGPGFNLPDGCPTLARLQGWDWRVAQAFDLSVPIPDKMGAPSLRFLQGWVAVLPMQRASVTKKAGRNSWDRPDVPCFFGCVQGRRNCPYNSNLVNCTSSIQRCPRMASPAGIRTIRTLTSFASGPVSKYPQRSLRRHIWNPPTKIPELVVDLRTHWPHHIYKGAVPEMDHRETYLLLFSGFSA